MKINRAVSSYQEMLRINRRYDFHRNNFGVGLRFYQRLTRHGKCNRNFGQHPCIATESCDNNGGSSEFCRCNGFDGRGSTDTQSVVYDDSDNSGNGRGSICDFEFVFTMPHIITYYQ